MTQIATVARKVAHHIRRAVLMPYRSPIAAVASAIALVLVISTIANFDLIYRAAMPSSGVLELTFLNDNLIGWLAFYVLCLVIAGYVALKATTSLTAIFVGRARWFGVRAYFKRDDVVIVSVIFFLVAVIPALLGEWSSYLKFADNDAVAFFLAVASIVAFYISVRQLNDFHNRITTFSQLLDTITVLSREASDGNEFHIVAHTPAIGCLADPGRWEKLRDAMIGNARYIRVITQYSKTLAQWHNNFEGRSRGRGKVRTITTENRKRANTESGKIKKFISLYQNYFEVPESSLPGYYFFFNANTAIIVAPLFLPLNSGALEDKNRCQALDIRQSLPSPHMIGFRTNDSAIIEYLGQQYDYIRDMPKPFTGPNRASCDQLALPRTKTKRPAPARLQNTVPELKGA